MLIKEKNMQSNKNPIKMVNFDNPIIIGTLPNKFLLQYYENLPRRTRRTRRKVLIMNIDESTLKDRIKRFALLFFVSFVSFVVKIKLVPDCLDYRLKRRIKEAI